QPLDSSSTFGVWVGEFSLSLSAARQRLVDVPPPQLLPVSQEGARNTMQACRTMNVINLIRISLTAWWDQRNAVKVILAALCK
ncbi:MAG: hypothetical protein U1D41_04385, partial [Nitrosomonas sp.]|uniref:hypothetical protein n=1 Tax=Nitrosomonas sp. TaxID=42353 RepID=UPI002ABAFAAC